jgi:nucleoside-diphosphate-sugar epimerase
MKKVILITGSSGFVGKHVLNALEKRDVLLRLVLRKSSTIPIKNSNSIEKVIYSQNIFLESKEWWVDSLKGVDAVMHLAWFVDPATYLDSIKNDECFFGTVNLAQAVIDAKVGKFLGVGTCLEYDLNSPPLSVDTALNPISRYAKTKAKTFEVLKKLFANANTKFVWCRLFYLYGEGEKPERLWPYIMVNLRDGNLVKISQPDAIRDYLNIKVAATQLVDFLLGPYVGPVNVCSGIPITIKAFAEKFANECGRSDLLVYEDTNSSYGFPRVIWGVKGGK